MFRRIAGIVIAFLLVLGLCGFALRRYLQSEPLREKVVAHFKSVYKGDVKLGGIDVGLDNTSMTKLELFEAGTGAKTPWLEIAELHTDLSILDYFQGNSLPSKIKISGAKVLLRFAADGTLLTTLPEPLTRASWENSEESNRFTSLPVFEFENSQVTLRTQGAEDVVFRQVSGKLDRNAEQLTFLGDARHETWGKWKITGLLQKQSAKISLQFKSDGNVHVTGAMLEKLPFVPAECWHELRVSRMDTPLLVHVDYDLKHGDTHCRAELEPVNANFQVMSLGTDVANASAKVVFENNQMVMRGLQGETCSGIVRGGADVTFDDEGVRIEGQVEARRLEVSQMPAVWGLPPQLSGKLSGIAALKVVIRPSDLTAPNVSGMVALGGIPFGPVDFSAALLGTSFEKTARTEGSGRGQIVDAVAGEVRVNTIGIELHAVPGGFRLGNAVK